VTSQDPSAAAPDDLFPGRVCIYSLVVPPGCRDLALGRATAAQVLSPAELERFDRYQVQHRRNDLVLSRVMLRLVLSRLGLDGAGDFELTVDANGKPHAASRTGSPILYFNTSDTAGMITWAFSRQGPLGCDVEWIGQDKDAIADSHFAPPELAGYRALAGVNRTRRFYELWTLKEALLKADGRGLGIPLDSFSFHLAGPGPDRPPTVEILDPLTGPAPGPWRFHSFRPDATHQAAVAVRAPGEVTFQTCLLRAKRICPTFTPPWEFVIARDHPFASTEPETVLFSPER
jgi:4'-phosphopantetheinyl transferase